MIFYSLLMQNKTKQLCGVVNTAGKPKAHAHKMAGEMSAKIIRVSTGKRKASTV
jgi:hypothetical protein